MPVIGLQGEKGSTITAAFMQVISDIGGEAILADAADAVRIIQEEHAGAGVTVNSIDHTPGYNAHQYAQLPAPELEAVDVLIIRGGVAVAENGAVWIPESRMVNRLLPFISRRLVVVVEEQAIVPTLHEAYALVQTDKEGYGAFIAGPSKTADIEQSLVVGAHGPLSFRVVIIKQ